MVGKVEVACGGVGAVSRATIEAKVIRADGSVEDLGIIADSGLLRQRTTFLQRVKGLFGWTN